MQAIILMQFARSHYRYDDELFVFFDRCILHMIGLDPDDPALSARPSSTDRLYALAEAA